MNDPDPYILGFFRALMNRQPYIGLRAFSQEEQNLFFGREQHSNELIERLNNQHFLAVVGDSGCGKSSLIKAGLIPALQAGFLTEAGSHWRIAQTRPGNQPFANLAEALCQDSALGKDYATALLKNRFLTRSPFSLHELLAIKPLPNHAKLLIVCDQFEELFRYAKQQINAEDAAAFVALLLASANRYPLVNGEVSHSVYVILTMRSDYLGNCAQFAGLAEAINQGLYLTPRLNRQQLRTAIERPALVCNGKIEPALLGRLLNEIGNDADQLPLLQHILMRLWDLSADKILTVQAYEKIGGLIRAANPLKDGQSCDNALSRHADEVFNELNDTQKLLAKQIFCRLTNAETGKSDTRNPTTVKDLMALTGQNKEQLAAVLKPFRQAGRCFLLPPETIELTEDSVIDISHESLIRQWQTLQNWVREEAQAAQTYRHLLEAALRYRNNEVGLLQQPELGLMLQWQKTFKPTAAWAMRYGRYEEDFPKALTFLNKSLKRHWLKKAAILSVFLAIIALAIFSFWQWQEAERHKRLAQKEQQRAEKQKNLAIEVITQFTYDTPEKLANIPRTSKLTRKILELNIEKLDEIHALNPGDKETQIKKADNYQKIGKLWLNVLNDGSNALDYQLKSYELRLILIKNGETAMLNKDLLSNLSDLGDTYFKLGQTGNALEYYKQYHEMAKKMAQLNPDNTELQSKLSISYLKLGNLSLSLKKTQEGLTYYQQSLQIKENVFKKNPNSNTKVSLMVGLGKVGNAYLQFGQPRNALKYYEQSLKGFKEIAEQNPEDIQAQRDVFVNYQKLGDLYATINDNKKALENYNESFKIILKIAGENKDDNSLQEELMEAYQYLADTYSKLNNIENSKQMYEEAFKIAQELYGYDPENKNVQTRLLSILNQLTDLYKKLKDKKNFNDFVVKAMPLVEKLAKDKSSDAVELLLKLRF